MIMSFKQRKIKFNWTKDKIESQHVQEFIADLELHELALQRGIPGIL